MFTPEQLNALGSLVQSLAVLVGAIAALYAAVRGHTNGAKLDIQGKTIDTVAKQTNGLVASLVTASGDAGYIAGATGNAQPTPPIVTGTDG